jgi:GntR family transcriptional regulator/MocR family aminotransferase
MMWNIQFCEITWSSEVSMLRPWPLQILIDRSGPTPAYLQITHALIEAIRRGRLASGSALPGTRNLAAQLSVNRKTVEQAYDEMVAQGWLTAESTRGTFVSGLLPAIGPVPAPSLAASPAQAPEFTLRRTAPNLPLMLPGPGQLVFDDGAPDTRLMPAELLGRTYRRALLDASRRNRLGYGDPRGSLALRQAVADMLKQDRGLECGPQNVCLTRGSQMGIYLSARLVAEPGDAVVVETLTYPPAREAFRAAGAKILSVGLDDQGMRVDELEACCRKQRVRAVYVTPHHQFPTTVLMPPERRIRLLALAEQFGFAVVEDDYDHEFHFAHRPMLPMASLHNWGKLLYIGSLSKLLSPSLRIGYLVGAEAAIERAAGEIMLIDRQGDPATEMAVAELMVSGAVKSHTRKVLKIYAERRGCLADALRKQLGTAVEFSLPQGGLAIWIRFAAGLDPVAISEAAETFGVGFTPGAAFASSSEISAAGARLGFASMDETVLREAVSRLAAAVQRSKDSSKKK